MDVLYKSEVEALLLLGVYYLISKMRNKWNKQQAEEPSNEQSVN